MLYFQERENGAQVRAAALRGMTTENSYKKKPTVVSEMASGSFI